MKLKNLISVLIDATNEGANRALSESGLLNEHLSKSQAYRLYGRSNVDRWIQEGILEVSLVRNNTKQLIERKKLEAIAASSNRITYLQVVER